MVGMFMYMYTTCRVGVLLSEISTLENKPTPLFEKPLNFLAHGCIIGRLRYNTFYHRPNDH